MHYRHAAAGPVRGTLDGNVRFRLDPFPCRLLLPCMGEDHPSGGPRRAGRSLSAPSVGPAGRTHRACRLRAGWALVASASLLAGAVPPLPGPAWTRHAIDDIGHGADGIRLADVNADGRPDAASGWEEDGSTRIYLNGGAGAVRERWPKVVLPDTPSIEDASLVDLDGDGGVDVVSATEGKSRQLIVHWAPAGAAWHDPGRWRRQSFPATAGLTSWMYVTPAQVDGQSGVDLIAGGKADGGDARSVLGWLESPDRPRDLAAWRWHPLAEVGWTMSIEWEDMDGDRDADLVYSDRFGATRGVYWLENPGPRGARAGDAWTRHRIGATDATEVKFLSLGDLDGDGRRDVAVAVTAGPPDPGDPSADNRVVWLRREDATGRRWTSRVIAAPKWVGAAKAVAIGDVDGDGRADLVLSCEQAREGRSGVYWLRQGARVGEWEPRDISGPAGIKFDVVRLADLDGDGDLDVLTSEERESGRGLGVVWYENPTRRPAGKD